MADEIPEVPRGERLTRRQVAHRLDCSERQVSRFVSTGRLPKGVKDGKKSYWFIGDIAVYLYRLARGDFAGLEPIPDDEDDEDDDPPPETRIKDK